MANILIIDDEEQIRDILRHILENVDHKVTEASNGVEGLGVFRKRPADLVIIDMIMPRKDGIETILDLKMEAPNVKIIAMTGGGRIGPKDYLEVAEGIGASHILPKPILKDKLLKMVQEVLD